MKKYFSGFALKNEQELFHQYTSSSEYEVVGFSYGAIQACEYTYNTQTRIDKLILLSPAFFQTKPNKYKKIQLQAYEQNNQNYIQTFLNNITKPYSYDMTKYINQNHTKEQLSELLFYIWDEKMLQSIIDKNIKIEVYLAQNDKIIDHKSAYEFFPKFATVYYIKDTNHILQHKGSQ